MDKQTKATIFQLTPTRDFNRYLQKQNLLFDRIFFTIFHNTRVLLNWLFRCNLFSLLCMSYYVGKKKKSIFKITHTRRYLMFSCLIET